MLEATQELSTSVSKLQFSNAVAHVYNPLDYAWAPHQSYLTRYGIALNDQPRSLLLGMNPGPFGMAQTGVPFGAVGMVRDWLGLDRDGDRELEVGRPANEHPKRIIQGFDCPREEVSGTRLWGLAKDEFSSPENFFRRFFVGNYCPLIFLHESGRNITPDKLLKSEREQLTEICDRGLAKIGAALNLERVIGVGAYAETAAKRAFGAELPIGRILHPSPASPAANRGWAEVARKQLIELGAL